MTGKILEKKTGRPLGHPSLNFAYIQRQPEVFSRIFPASGTNNEYESSCFYGPKYQSSKL